MPHRPADIPVLAVICHHDADLLPHFLQHYRRMGASSFQLTLQGEWNTAAIRSLQGMSDVTVKGHETGAFSDSFKLQRLNAAAKRHMNQWVLCVDADEFLQLPLKSLAQTIDWLERLGANALQAMVVPRLAEGGRLPKVVAETDCNAEFPHFNVQLAEDMGFTEPTPKFKFPLARVGPDFNLAKYNQLPPNPDIAFHVPLRGVVHHFKYRAQPENSIGSRGDTTNKPASPGVHQEWLGRNDGRLPTINSKPCNTEALIAQGLLVAPTRSQLHSTLRRKYQAGQRTKGRIALISFELTGPDRTGGIATAIGALAEALSNDGQEVHIVYCPYNNEPKDSWHRWLEYWGARGVHLHYLDRLEHDARLSFEQFSQKVSDYLERLRAQVLHFVDADAYGAAAAVQRHLGRAHTKSRIITTLHGPMSWHRRGNMLEEVHEEQLNLRGLKLLLQTTDVACYPSDYMRSWVHENLQIVPRCEVLIPNCLPGTSRHFKVPEMTPLPVREIVLFGRLEWRKGLHRFAEAISQLTGNAQDVPITLLGRLGDTQSKEQIEDLLGVTPDRLRLITEFGSFDAIHYLKARDCVAVVPSTLDNSPYTVFECLEAGIPLLASSIGGIPELIDSRDHAHVLRADDAESLAIALQSAVSDGLRPGRLAFDPAHAEQKHLELHANQVAQAKTRIHEPARLDNATVRAFRAAAQTPPWPMRLLGRLVSATRAFIAR